TRDGAPATRRRRARRRTRASPSRDGSSGFAGAVGAEPAEGAAEPPEAELLGMTRLRQDLVADLGQLPHDAILGDVDGRVDAAVLQLADIDVVMALDGDEDVTTALGALFEELHLDAVDGQASVLAQRRDEMILHV